MACDQGDHSPVPSTVSSSFVFEQDDHDFEQGSSNTRASSRGSTGVNMGAASGGARRTLEADGLRPHDGGMRAWMHQQAAAPVRGSGSRGVGGDGSDTNGGDGGGSGSRGVGVSSNGLGVSSNGLASNGFSEKHSSNGFSENGFLSNGHSPPSEGVRGGERLAAKRSTHHRGGWEEFAGVDGGIRAWSTPLPAAEVQSKDGGDILDPGCGSSPRVAHTHHAPPSNGHSPCSSVESFSENGLLSNGLLSNGRLYGGSELQHRSTVVVLPQQDAGPAEGDLGATPSTSEPPPPQTSASAGEHPYCTSAEGLPLSNEGEREQGALSSPPMDHAPPMDRRHTDEPCTERATGRDSAGSGDSTKSGRDSAGSSGSVSAGLGSLAFTSSLQGGDSKNAPVFVLENSLVGERESLQGVVDDDAAEEACAVVQEAVQGIGETEREGLGKRNGCTTCAEQWGGRCAEHATTGGDDVLSNGVFPPPREGSIAARSGPPKGVANGPKFLQEAVVHLQEAVDRTNPCSFGWPSPILLPVDGPVGRVEREEGDVAPPGDHAPPPSLNQRDPSSGRGEHHTASVVPPIVGMQRGDHHILQPQPHSRVMGTDRGDGRRPKTVDTHLPGNGLSSLHAGNGWGPFQRGAEAKEDSRLSSRSNSGVGLDTMVEFGF